MKQKHRFPQFDMALVWMLLMLLSVQTASADPPVATSSNYRLFRDVEASTGAISSISYKMIGIAGEPSALDQVTSSSYKLRPDYNFEVSSVPPPPPPPPPSADPPAPPTGLSVLSFTGSEILIQWGDNSDNEDGFIIERTDSMSPWARVTVTGADAATYTDTTVRCSWQYSYRVCSYNAGGNSEYAVIAKIITADCPPYDPLPSSISLDGETGAGCGGTITVPENQPVGTFIGNLSAEDATPGGDTHTYALFAPQGVLGCNLSFSIRGNSLYTAKPFDYEMKKSCRIWIQTHDAHSNLKTCHYDVTVTDVPEAPYDLILKNYNGVSENMPAGTAVGTFFTKDDDGDTGHTYELVPGEGDTDNGLFTVSGDTLKTNTVLDYEAGAVLSILVRTYDRSGAAFAKQFTITVKDEADPPVISETDDLSTDDEIAVKANFTVSDQDTSVSSLTLSAESDNPDLLPVANITFGSSGANRTITLTPVRGMSGTAEITVTVSDGYLTASTSFMLTVTTGESIRVMIRPESDSRGTAVPGEILGYIVDISNTGDKDAEEVVFMLPVPANTTYVPDSADVQVSDIETSEVSQRSRVSPPEYDEELSQLEWTGDIPAGGQAEIVFDVTVNDDAETGDVITADGWSLFYDSDGDGENDISAEQEDDPDASENLPVRIEIPESECVKGDVNGDSVCDLEDAVMVLRTLIGIGTDAADSLCADVNRDGKTGLPELFFILNHIAG